MSDLQCPKCGAPLRFIGGGAFCSKDDSECDIKLWRKVAGKSPTDEQLGQIVNGERILVKGLQSKKKTAFDAYLIRNDSGQVDFDFEGLSKK